MLRPLAESGFFDAPPEAEPTENGFRLPVWSQSLYLVRVAPADPEGVADVIAAIPETENMNTQCHYLQAAAVMPGRYAAAVAQRQVAWLRSHPNTIDWVVLAAEPLARKLASEGEIDSALPLLDALLETRPPEGSGGRRRLLNRLYISQYHMRALANGPLKELAARAPTRTLSMLCGALERAQEGESSLWRTAIEPDGQNVEFDALAVVVDVTRDLASEVARRPEFLTKVVEDLERRKAPIFHRLAIHVLRTASPTRSPELLARLASPELSASSECFHEIAAALLERFGEFTQEQQAEIRQAMRKDAERAAARAGPDGAEVRDARLSTWFQIIEPWLPEEDRAEFDALVGRTGRWPHPGYRSWHSHGRPHPTRFTYEQVASLATPSKCGLVVGAMPTEEPAAGRRFTVVLETNLLHGRADPEASTPVKTILDLAEKIGASVAIPEPCVMELVQGHRERLIEGRNALDKAVKELGRLRATVDLREIEVEAEVKGYEQRLVTFLDTHRIRRLAFPEQLPPPQELFERAVAKQPPFDAKGASFRDAMIGMTVARHFPAGSGEVLIVTGDNSFRSRLAVEGITALDPDAAIAKLTEHLSAAEQKRRSEIEAAIESVLGQRLAEITERATREVEFNFGILMGGEIESIDAFSATAVASVQAVDLHQHRTGGKARRPSLASPTARPSSRS